MKQENKWLVPKRDSDGKYFRLYCDYATTSYGYVDNIFDAELIPYPTGGDKIIHYPEYYFENSSRMKEWLKGFRMVVVNEIKEMNEEPIKGPTYKEIENELLDRVTTNRK